MLLEEKHEMEALLRCGISTMCPQKEHSYRLYTASLGGYTLLEDEYWSTSETRDVQVKRLD